MSEINVNALGDRKKMVENFGIWFSEKASKAEIVSWCDERIKKLDEWKTNCLELRKQCQKELLNGLSIEELKAAIENRQGGQN